MQGEDEEPQWTELPTFAPILAHLGSMEIKTMRKVCRGWRRDVDASLSWLKPRSLNTPYGMAEVARFSMIDTLDATCLVGPSADHLVAFAAMGRLRSLSVRGNWTTDDRALATLAEALTNLTALRFINAKALLDEGLQSLRRLENLSLLNLHGADGLHGWGLMALQSCPKLRDLNVTFCCNLDGGGASALADLTQLTCLELEGCRLDQANDPTSDIMYTGSISEETQQRRQALIKLVTQLTGLQRLNMNNCGEMTASWLAPHLRHLVNLTYLAVGDRSSLSHDAGVVEIARLTTLKWLSLAGLGPLKGHTIDQLSRLKALTHLDLSIHQLQDKHLVPVTRLKRLRSLVMLGCHRVSDTAFASLGRRLPSLECLTLSKSKLSKAGLHTFPTNPVASSLRRIQLESCDKVSTWMGPIFSQLSGLTSILLPGNRFVSGTIVEPLAALPALVHLDISSCEMVTDDSLTQLSRLTSLSHLDLSFDQVGDEGLCGVAHLTALTQLGLGNTDILDTGMSHLSGLRRMHRLDLFGTHITDSGLQHLSGMTALQHLHIGYCLVTNVGIRKHLFPLAADHSLAHIDLDKAPNVSVDVRQQIACCTIRGSLRHRL